MRIGGHVRIARWTIVVMILTIWCGFASASASAKIVHEFISRFNGNGSPTGAFQTAGVTSVAIDQATGTVWTLESNFAELGHGVVTAFTSTGAYAGVQINGTTTPRKANFAFGIASGVAVDNSLGVNGGDVYVADSEHGVVDRFDESGEFQCQITGKTFVSESKEEREHECDPTTGSATPGGSIVPAGMVVDSSGDLYVADDAHATIEEFGPEGKWLKQIENPMLSTEMGSIALDNAGGLYVANWHFLAGGLGDVVKIGPTETTVFTSGAEAATVAVDQANDRVYVAEYINGTQLVVGEREVSGTLLGQFAVNEVEEGIANYALAVNDTSRHLYIGGMLSAYVEAGVNIFTSDVVIPGVKTAPATNIGTSSATLNGSVDPDTAHGGGPVTECEFEYVTEAQVKEHPFKPPFEGAAKASCVPATPIAAATSVSANVTLAPDTTYRYRLAAASSEGANNGEAEAEDQETFTTSGPPAVDSQNASLSVTNGTAEAEIDPFGYDTTCRFQYVDETSFKTEGYAKAETLPCTPADLGSGFGDQKATVELGKLSIDTTYHMRFVATNQVGVTEGADQTFSTFGIKDFSVQMVGPKGEPFTQAGGHPYKLITSFDFNPRPKGLATANPKDIVTELPPGIVGNPNVVAKCTRAELSNEHCSGAAQVGVLQVRGGGSPSEKALYNMVPPPGVPVEFGWRIQELNVYIDFSVRTGGDYGVTANVLNAITPIGVTGTTAEVWGVPAESSHDSQRECPVLYNGKFQEKAGCSVNVQPQPFLIAPVNCAAEKAGLSVDAWQDPGAFVAASYTTPASTGCNRMKFAPTISVLPDTSASDSPSGLLVKLHIPQDEAPEGLATPSMRSAAVSLPPGVTLNPSAANGLSACSQVQIGLDDALEPSCPDSSKIGSIEIETPLLPDTLQGSAYLAEQSNNPFDSTFAMYVAAHADGVIIKVAGRVEVDPITGHLVGRFEETPQLPFSDFRLHFFGGPRAPLATPKVCGTYLAEAMMTPWSAPESGPPATPSIPMQITTGPGGAPCSTPGFKPSFTAGMTSNQAGGFSPFTFTMGRGDGEQNLGTVSTILPPGVSGLLANVPLCGEPQASEGKCSAASMIGHVVTGVGAGPFPLFVPGPGTPVDPVYLTGPYRGAPFGLSVVVPAEAGPFNLDENGRPVIVRAQVRIDPITAQVTVTSDPLPQILQGVPLDIRAVNVVIDHPQFMINPTSCEPMQITANLTSGLGTPATLTTPLVASSSVPFQVTNCAALAFKPLFSVSTNGKVSRRIGASLHVKLNYPSGSLGSQANIASVKVDLPKQLPSNLRALQHACTAATFNANPAACPSVSRVGEARATTPLLPVPLTGPAYFVSYGGAKFPELVIVLSGYGVTVDLHGETFINEKTNVTSSTFHTVPDVPVGTFELTLPQKPEYSALAAPDGLCGHTLKMPTQFVAQNGAIIKQATPITITNCTKHKAKKASKRHK